jgi:pentatricopeptide repeat protein
MNKRPPNPTPSRQFNIEQQRVSVSTTKHNLLKKSIQNNDTNNNSSSKAIYTFGSGESKRSFHKQPSLSDLIKANLVTIDGTDRGMGRTPSLSDLMDFEISADDLLSETNNYHHRNNSNTKKREPGNSQIQTSPLAKARRGKHTPAVYQTWNDSKERRDRAYKHLHLDSFYKSHATNTVLDKNTKKKNIITKPRAPRRPAAKNTYKLKDASKLSETREILVQGYSAPRQENVNITNENASHVADDYQFPPRPKSPCPFEGRRSAWDNDSESDSSSVLSCYDDDNNVDPDLTSFQNPKYRHSDNNTMNDNDINNVKMKNNIKVKLYLKHENNDQKSISSAKKNNTTATDNQQQNGPLHANASTKIPTSISTAQIDRISAKIIRLCLDEREDYILDSLDYAIHLYNRLRHKKVVLKLPGVYKHLILRCCREKKIVQALDIFNHMCDANVTIPIVVWENINSALLHAGMLEKCIGMISNMRWRKMVVKNEFYIITMLAYISIGQIDLANTLLQQFPPNVPIPLIKHVIDVCESLFQNHAAVGFRAQENAMLELISSLDAMCGNSPRHNVNAVNDVENHTTISTKNVGSVDDSNNLSLLEEDHQDHLIDYNLPLNNDENMAEDDKDYDIGNNTDPLSPSRSSTTSLTAAHQVGVDEIIDKIDFFNDDVGDEKDDDEKERVDNLINAGLYIKQ